MFLYEISYKGDVMELRQLECFVKTAELGSFTKASLQLHISQPALSKNISLLEERLGVKLFDRQGKKVRLNETGRRVLAHAQEILKGCDAITAICQAAKQQETHAVTLQMTAGSEYLPEILSGFQQLHPEVAILSLQNHSLGPDAGDILVSASVHGSNAHGSCAVLEESLALAVPPGHPLFAQKQVTFGEIAQHPIISLRTGTDMRAIEDHYFQRAGITPQRMVECDTPATLRALIKSGFGIAFVPTVTWRSILDSRLRLLPVQGSVCTRYITVSFTHPERVSSTARALFDFIVAYFQNVDTQSAKIP